MEGKVHDVLDRLSKLKANRQNFDSLWQDVADVTNPHGGDYNRRSQFPGEKRTEHLFEMTAANAREKFIAVMEAYHTPRHQRWQHLRASVEELNESNAVKAFFDEVEASLFRQRNAPRARFYGQAYEVYGSLADTGNGCLFVDEDPETGTARYRYTHIGNTWIETNWEGRIDTVYHEYKLSNRAALQKWPEGLPSQVTSRASTDPTAEETYLHVVRPRKDRDRASNGPDGKPWESLHIHCDSESLIGSPGGYEEMPYIWTRYRVNPNEMYGRGPGMLVLPDIHTLQEMQKTLLRSGRRVADPPLLARDDTQLGFGSKKIRLANNGITYGGIDEQGRPTIQPLVTNARVDFTDAMMDRIRENIREAYLNTHFELFATSERDRTATEVLELAKEKGQLLTPIIGRQQSEFLGPLTERELGILQRNGKIPPLPDELVEAQGEYEIEYESDATRMQRTDEVAAFVRLTEVMLPHIQNDPRILANIDADQAFRHYGHDLGVPAKLFRSEDEMAQIHQAEQQAAQAAQMAEQAPPVAGALRDLSEVAAA